MSASKTNLQPSQFWFSCSCGRVLIRASNAKKCTDCGQLMRRLKQATRLEYERYLDERYKAITAFRDWIPGQPNENGINPDHSRVD